MDGPVQPAGILWRFEAAHPGDAGHTVSAGIYQWFNEREHGAVVWQYVGLEQRVYLMNEDEQGKTSTVSQHGVDAPRGISMKNL